MPQTAIKKTILAKLAASRMAIPWVLKPRIQPGKRR
jgi:hypothetical protein